MGSGIGGNIFQTKISHPAVCTSKRCARAMHCVALLSLILRVHNGVLVGTIGGSNYGVAKAATIIGVKVLNQGGSGSYA